MSDLARTDRIVKRGVTDEGIDALVLIKHDGIYESYEGRVTNVTFESSPYPEVWGDWVLTLPAIEHSLTINFSGNVTQRLMDGEVDA